MKLLEKKRDELAIKHANYWHSTEEETHDSMPKTLRGYCLADYKTGFNAAVKELEPMIKLAYEILNEYSINGDISEHDLYKFLENYKQIMEDVT